MCGEQNEDASLDEIEYRRNEATYTIARPKVGVLYITVCPKDCTTFLRLEPLSDKESSNWAIRGWGPIPGVVLNYQVFMSVMW